MRTKLVGVEYGLVIELTITQVLASSFKSSLRVDFIY